MPPEDTRVWNGRVEDGHTQDHEQFVKWLNGPEAQELFRRRRLTEYTLAQEGDKLMVTFKAPHTGDPRIMIDFLRYPGLWPDYWLFENSDVQPVQSGEVRAHWRRAEQD